jgi:hypothetical protein
MGCFTTPTPVFDPGKRVNYTLGLVLGVDEMAQDQAHHLGNFHAHQGGLHGFGTQWGLAVSVGTGGSPPQPEVVVEAGKAVSPSGHSICVPRRMCAKLDDWLNTNRDRLANAFGPPPFPMTLCVVLCYRECATDIVPVPGEPCRNEADVMQPSRIADAFELRLCVHSPAGSFPGSFPTSFPTSFPGPPGFCSCPVHNARSLGEAELARLLRRLQIGAPGVVATEAQIITAALAIGGDIPALLAGAHPGDGPDLIVDPLFADSMQRLALRTWLTRVLPGLLAADKANDCGDDPEKCVQLAEVSFTVSAANRVENGVPGVTVDETARPLLLSTAMLQQWLLGGGPVRT